MRIYLGGVTRPALKKAHQVAPSHVYGSTWTPNDTRLPEVPYFVDNGIYTDSFDPDEWTSLLDRLSEYSYGPDFVVLPDAYNDAEKTLERHRKWVNEVLYRNLPAAAVIQPGLPVKTQVALAESIGAKFAFVGGQNRWKWATIDTIVEEAHKRGLAVHVGNPGGEDGLVRCYKSGVDSADTSTIKQNGYWHYLEKLEAITQDHSKGTPLKKGRQGSLTDQYAADGGFAVGEEVRGGDG